MRELGTGELYHNRAGAYAEALQHYVLPSGLLNKLTEHNPETKFSVMDVCFGLGYNTWVLLNELSKLNNNTKQSIATNDKKLNICLIENDPKMFRLSLAILKQHFFQKSGLFDALSGFLSAIEHNIYYQTLSKRIDFMLPNGINVSLEAICGDLRQVLPKLAQENFGKYQVVFHDPFSPRKMPELWTPEVFRAYADLLKPQGRLLTYSTASVVRKTMESLGFEWSMTPPLGGKRGGSLGILKMKPQI